MRKDKGLIILACLLQFACVTDRIRKTKIDIPAYSSINRDRFEEIIFTNFRMKTEIKDFDLNKALVDYLAFDLARRFKGKVTVRTVSWEKEGLVEDPDFWKNLAPGKTAALFLTGSALYTQEIRKALLEKEAKEIDGPFKPVHKGLSERRVFTLALDLYLIQAETGEIIYHKEFKETRIYINSNQPFSFAFYELLPNIKQPFFRALLGDEKLQERFLMTR